MVGIARITVEPSAVEMAPGQPSLLTISVANDSEVVEAYNIRFIGVDDEWVTVEPAPIRLLPGTTGTALATLEFPQIYPAGNHEIGVMITAESSDTQLDLTFITVSIEAKPQASLTVAPSTLSGGSKGRFSVVIRNEGNTDIGLGLETSDPEHAITAAFEPQHMTVEAGDTYTSEMVARGKRPWFGSPAPRVITVIGKGRSEPLESLVTFMQKPRIPTWALSILTVLLVLLAWLLALFLGIDRVLPKDDNVVSELFAITGTATDSQTSLPILGVVVSAFALENPEAPVSFALTAPPAPLSLQADGSYTLSADGSYQLEGLRPGLYKLRFDSPDFGSIWFNQAGGTTTSDGASVVSVTKDGGITPALPSVAFNKRATVCGLVTFAPVATPPPSAPAATTPPASCKPTAQTGVALLAGDGSTDSTDLGKPVHVTLDGVANGDAEPTATPTEVEQDPCANVVTYPPKPGAFAGVVTTLARLDTTKTPPTPIDGSSELVVTGADGSFNFADLPSPAMYELNLRAIGATSHTLTFELANGVDRRSDVTLVPGTQSITGEVLPADPKAACPVATIERPPEVAGVGNPDVATFALGADGSYAVQGLEPGSYKISASQERFGSASETVSLKAGVPADDVVLVLGGKPSEVRGTVTDADGAPLGGVTVTVNDQFTTVKSTTEDSMGQFSIPDLPTPASYTVTFVKSGFISQILAVDLPPGVVFDREITMQPVRTGDLSALFGTVVNSQQSPVAGATVVGSDGTKSFKTVTSDDPVGTYEFTDLAPGAYTLTFTSGDETTQVLRPLADGERLQVDAVLDVPAPIPLANIKLGPTGIFPFSFGDPAAEVLAALEKPLGPPTNDTGLIWSNGSYGTCPATRARIVWFGLLAVIITLGDPPPESADEGGDSDGDSDGGGADGDDATPTPEPTATVAPTPTPEPTAVLDGPVDPDAGTANSAEGDGGGTGNTDSADDPSADPATEQIEVISAWRLDLNFDPELPGDHPSRQLVSVEGYRLGDRDPTAGDYPAELIRAILSPDACKD